MSETKLTFGCLEGPRHYGIRFVPKETNKTKKCIIIWLQVISFVFEISFMFSQIPVFVWHLRSFVCFFWHRSNSMRCRPIPRTSKYLTKMAPGGHYIMFYILYHRGLQGSTSACHLTFTLHVTILCLYTRSWSRRWWWSQFGSTFWHLYVLNHRIFLARHRDVSTFVNVTQLDILKRPQATISINDDKKTIFLTGVFGA